MVFNEHKIIGYNTHICIKPMRILMLKSTKISNTKETYNHG